MARAALSIFAMPTAAVSWITCRCRLESDTMSSSTMPSVPTPAAARYCSTGAPSPPAPIDQHAGALQPLLAGAADLRQHDVARIAFEFFRRKRRRLVSSHARTIVRLGRLVSAASVGATVP